jgi:hypothetical protein
VTRRYMSPRPLFDVVSVASVPSKTISFPIFPPSGLSGGTLKCHLPLL